MEFDSGFCFPAGGCPEPPPGFGDDPLSRAMEAGARRGAAADRLLAFVESLTDDDVADWITARAVQCNSGMFEMPIDVARYIARGILAKLTPAGTDERSEDAHAVAEEPEA